MVKEVTVRRVGGSVGTTLPKDMADRLRVTPGDRLLAVETEDGILLTPYDPTPKRRSPLPLALPSATAMRSANLRSST